MNRSGYHTLIAPYYLKPMSAEAVALALNARLQSNVVTARMVNDVFELAYQQSFVLRQLGERPAAGFDQNDDRVKLAGALMAA